MRRSKIQLVVAIAVIILLIFGVFATLAIDSDFGKIDTTTVVIEDDNKELSGLLYRPKSATPRNPAPAVLVAHGISGSKEMMSSIGLELARKGFVALCLDLLGHGKSQGSVEEGAVDRSFGVYSALQYVKSQPYVNSSSLGLVGHSLGAGAVRATVAKETQVGATILVAGGLGNIAEEPEYGILNSTSPRNLLVIVGKYDVLFDLKKLTSEQLPAAFGTQQEIHPGVLYGEFETNTARKLVLPSTTHLFEPVDPTAIAETVAWIEDSLGKRQDPASPPNPGLIYVQREAAILLALAGLVGIAMLSFFPVSKLSHNASEKEPPKDDEAISHKWRLYAFWAAVNIVLLFPMLAVGSAIAFPPLFFGASIAWWMMSSGSVGVLALSKFSGRVIGRAFSLKQTLKDHFSKREAIGAIISFVIVFIIATILAGGSDFTFRIITPIFRDFTAARALVFPTFLPFFFLYFVAEGLFLHHLPQRNLDMTKLRSQIRNYVETLTAKTAPFIIILAVHYSGKILFDFWILSGFAGFLMEFLWLILPIFVITTSVSWWFHNRTQRIAYGALLNTLLMSWVASVVFPF